MYHETSDFSAVLAVVLQYKIQKNGNFFKTYNVKPSRGHAGHISAKKGTIYERLYTKPVSLLTGT